jgi:hypothetical protein
MTWGRDFLLASGAGGRLFSIAILLLSVLSANGGLFWGTIWFNNRGLTDPVTGEIYDAPIFHFPGEPWGAVPGAYAELVLVVGQSTFPIGRTTFRTNSTAVMPYLNPVVLEVPGYSPGTRSLTFKVRLYPGLFGQPTFDSAPFTVSSPLGGAPSDGGVPFLPPRIDGFGQIGCAEAVKIVPECALFTVGDDVQLQLVPAVPMAWSRITPTYSGLTIGSSLNFTNVQETDAGSFAAQGYCPGIPTLGPFTGAVTVFVVIPPIDLSTKYRDGMQHFSFTSRPTVIYSLQKSDTLTPAMWQEIAISTGIDGTAELVDMNKPGPMGFYRVIARLP